MWAAISVCGRSVASPESEILARHHQGGQRLHSVACWWSAPITCLGDMEDSALRQWGLSLASRGGKQSKSCHRRRGAALAVLLHRIWITQEQYIPFYAEAVRVNDVEPLRPRVPMTACRVGP